MEDMCLNFKRMFRNSLFYISISRSLIALCSSAGKIPLSLIVFTVSPPHPQPAPSPRLRSKRNMGRLLVQCPDLVGFSSFFFPIDATLPSFFCDMSEGLGGSLSLQEVWLIVQWGFGSNNQISGSTVSESTPCR